MEFGHEKTKPLPRFTLKPELGGVRGQLFEMFQIAENLSATALIANILEEYTVVSRELHQRNDDDAYLGLSLLGPRQEPLASEDFPWSGERHEGGSRAHMFGLKGEVVIPFLHEWTRNGGPDDLEAAFDVALYVYALERLRPVS